MYALSSTITYSISVILHTLNKTIFLQLRFRKYIDIKLFHFKKYHFLSKEKLEKYFRVSPSERSFA